MDSVRLGLSLRALRRRRGWTQAALAPRAGCSRALISLVERGEGDRLTGRTLARIADALGARLLVRLLWHGEDLDRLLDHDHSRLVEAIIRLLRAAGWQTYPEVTFQFGAERGAIDVLAFHPATSQLLVVEVKSVVPDIQATLSGLDRKARVARRVAQERGLPAGPVSRLLVLPEDSTTRRRVQLVATTLDAAYPARNVAVRRWLAAPADPLAGILFLPDDNHRGVRRAAAGGRRTRAHDGRRSVRSAADQAEHLGGTSRQTTR